MSQKSADENETITSQTFIYWFYANKTIKYFFVEAEYFRCVNIETNTRNIFGMDKYDVQLQNIFEKIDLNKHWNHFRDGKKNFYLQNIASNIFGNEKYDFPTSKHFQQKDFYMYRIFLPNNSQISEYEI